MRPFAGHSTRQPKLPTHRACRPQVVSPLPAWCFSFVPGSSDDTTLPQTDVERQATSLGNPVGIGSTRLLTRLVLVQSTHALAPLKTCSSHTANAAVIARATPNARNSGRHPDGPVCVSRCHPLRSGCSGGMGCRRVGVSVRAGKSRESVVVGQELAVEIAGGGENDCVR